MVEANMYPAGHIGPARPGGQIDVELEYPIDSSQSFRVACVHRDGPAPLGPESAARINDDYSSSYQKLHYIYYSADTQGIPAEANVILAQVTKYMRENPTRRIRIRGYTDSSGDTEYNLMISQHRAYAIKNHLIAKGIEAERISAKGFGARNFIASNKTAKLRALNRRVELELY